MKNKNNLAKKILISTIVLTLFFICLSSANAANVTLNPSDVGGVNSAVSIVANGSDVNNTITLNPGTYNKTTDRNNNITFSGKNLTIQGNGSTGSVIIDAQKLGRMFTITGNSNITFINISFINGNSLANGGSIYNTGKLTITNCTFFNNTADQINGSGGAIYNLGILAINNSIFINNNALQINGTGGAIYNSGVNSHIANSIFTNNSAYYRGGAIRNINGHNFTVDNCNFTNNIFLTESGGAIASQSSDNVTIINSLFIENKANSTRYAGAIDGYYCFNLNIINCTFINNTASMGGSLSLSAADCRVINSTFTDNRGNTYGGAIYNTGTNLTIINSIFNNNKGNTGGAIYNTGTNSTVINSTFNDNQGTSSGGAIYNTGDNLIITNSNFMNNNATNGGAIYNNGGTNMTVNNTTFTNNTANNTGGAIYNSGDNSIVGSSNFINNTALKAGGIFNDGSMLVSGNLMSGNHATVTGNVIYNNGSMGVLNLTYLNNSTLNVKRGKNVTLFATLIDDMGNPITGQNITFYVNGINIGSVEAVEGYANISYTVNEVGGAILPVNGTYNGIGSYNIIIKNGELKIQLITNSTINAPDGKVGKPINITGVVTDEMGNPLVNAQIVVNINGTSYNLITNNAGEWNLIFTSPISGNFNIIVLLNSYSVYESFINSTMFKVNKILANSTINAPDGKVGKPINITGVVTDEYDNPVGGVEINITIGNESFFTITNNDGTWNLPYSAEYGGNFTIIVSWIGNSAYTEFTNTTTFNIAKLGTSISIVAPNSTVGKIINIHGILVDEDGKLIANALIIIAIDGKKYTVTTDENGSWTLPYKTTHAGNIEILVSFEGNNIYLASKNTTTFNVKVNDSTNETKTNETNETKINETYETNLTNETYETNWANKIINTSIAISSMKKTGLPIIAILIVLLSILGLFYRKK